MDRRSARKWLMVDLGVAFAGDELPGIDLIMPDLAFIEKVKKDLVGIIITHAHEDHIGALADLWPSLGVQVYASPVRRRARRGAAARRAGRAQDPDPDRQARRARDDRPVRRRVRSGRPFDSRKLRAGDPHAGRTRRPHRRLEDRPDPGRRRCRPTKPVSTALGDEGVLALVCDSTNVLREGESPSERDVAATLKDLIGRARGRVVVTTFASNVARLRSAAEAGLAVGRQVCILGRAMERVVAVARELGMLDGVPPFLGMDAFDRLPRDKILALATGSQGEPRAALARMAEDDHPDGRTRSRRHGDLLLAHHSRQREGGRQDHQRLRRQRASRSSPIVMRSCTCPAIRAAPRSRECTAG